jgi:alpha-glucosidase
MIKNNLFLIFLFTIQVLFSQVTFIVEALPENTSENASIFISGDFEAWTGGQEEYKLIQNKKSYAITLPIQTGEINFKFTQGSWNTVETDMTGNNIDNRTYIFGETKDTVMIKIANWISLSPKKSTALKNVSIISEDFKIHQLNRTRRIWIYLPPDYDKSKKSYPVIYMHDAQNLFDEATSYNGEWQVDETLNKLFKERDFGLIVVGIDNGGPKRMDEYSPWENDKYKGGGQGDAYLDFIVKTLKPYVDKSYRTLFDNPNTAIMGSSLGGLISHYGALRYPGTFGLAGVFSPAFGFSEMSYDFSSNPSDIKGVRIYFLAGDKESPTMVSNMNNMISLMKSNGFTEKNIMSKVVPGGEHNEKLWRENFEEAIIWLFDKKYDFD